MAKKKAKSVCGLKPEDCLCVFLKVVYSTPNTVYSCLALVTMFGACIEG